MKLKQSVKLKEEAKKNTSLMVKNNRTGEVLKEDVGVPLEHSAKHLSGSQVGMSIGVTINMDNYQSLRVDLWLTDAVHDGETQKEAYKRIHEVIDETLEETARYCVETFVKE